MMAVGSIQSSAAMEQFLRLAEAARARNGGVQVPVVSRLDQAQTAQGARSFHSVLDSTRPAARATATPSRPLYATPNPVGEATQRLGTRFDAYA